MHSKFARRAAILLTITLTGCYSTDRMVGRPDLSVVQQGDLPAPLGSDQILQQRPYLIGPLDKVVIEVYQVPELTRTLQVDANGQISLPLLGTVSAAGKSPAELATYITENLRGRYVRNPQVTVNADTINQTFTVDGQVKEPGLYPVLGKMTLQRAVASAKGLSEYANTNYVVIFRQVGDRQMAGIYDLRAIRQGQYPDPEVFTNDIVLVGESGGRRAIQNIIASGALLTGPLIAILQ
ncbi:polysaccharide biosynthesis/export family protein [Sphingomonas sp. Leaf25]|uniref:polysaccharide biosynthesis/export family protein n=1 Tax=Sphingomonas sp. Leaf25 TaxID=1735692 RepID=UPI000B05F055|nr:polysaccharide biosynthesis/export family protein [Sphingomonas sp. Leaf25]